MVLCQREIEPRGTHIPLLPGEEPDDARAVFHAARAEGQLDAFWADRKANSIDAQQNREIAAGVADAQRQNARWWARLG